MSDSDELQRLRDADPVRSASIPSADDPGPRALLERIIMSDTRTSWLRSRAAVLSAASMAAVLIAAGAVVLANRGPASQPDPGPGPMTPGGSAMCVELYSLETLANRETAFAGTVVSVNGDEVTLSVDEWFKGGTESEVTLAGVQTLGGTTSVGEGVPLEPGSRLLVAGDGGFAWSCGFTQPFDEEVAADWRATLT